MRVVEAVAAVLKEKEPRRPPNPQFFRLRQRASVIAHACVMITLPWSTTLMTTERRSPHGDAPNEHIFFGGTDGRIRAKKCMRFSKMKLLHKIIMSSSSHAPTPTVRKRGVSPYSQYSCARAPLLIAYLFAVSCAPARAPVIEYIASRPSGIPSNAPSGYRLSPGHPTYKDMHWRREPAGRHLQRDAVERRRGSGPRSRYKCTHQAGSAGDIAHARGRKGVHHDAHLHQDRRGPGLVVIDGPSPPRILPPVLPPHRPSPLLHRVIRRRLRRSRRRRIRHRRRRRRPRRRPAVAAAVAPAGASAAVHPAGFTALPCSTTLTSPTADVRGPGASGAGGLLQRGALPPGGALGVEVGTDWFSGAARPVSAADSMAYGQSDYRSWSFVTRQPVAGSHRSVFHARLVPRYAAHGAGGAHRVKLRLQIDKNPDTYHAYQGRPGIQHPLWIHTLSELGNLRKLDRLLLSSNQLSGTIPTELGNMGSSIARFLGLELNRNRLSGTILSEPGQPPHPFQPSRVHGGRPGNIGAPPV